MNPSVTNFLPPQTLVTSPRIIRQATSTSSALPPKKKAFYRLLRHPMAMPYNRLAISVVIINITVAVILGQLGFDSIPLATFMNVILANFAVAILIRQQYVINALFKVATSVPLSWPLSIRWACGKVYHFGGVHVGGFFSATLWFAYYLGRLTTMAAQTKPAGATWMAWVHLPLLVSMIIMALPTIRARYHNYFEMVARFGSWLSLLLFWYQTVAFSQFGPSGRWTPLILAPQFWVLSLITFSIALPWLRLRRVSVNLARPSSHATLAHFDYGVTPFAGSSTELSRNPLLEWHSFANVPTPGQEGFRLTISRAGDWTGRLIDEQPEKLWVKGIPTAGVGNIETIFKKVIWVATGSGIGPCLPHLFANRVPSRLVWSTKNPQRTYGDSLVAEITAAQPNAVIWDTDNRGKPDLVALAYQAYRDLGAEAIICIANKKVTWQVCQEFESRGIPAFGAIWDS